MRSAAMSWIISLIPTEHLHKKIPAEGQILLPVLSLLGFCGNLVAFRITFLIFPLTRLFYKNEPVKRSTSVIHLVTPPWGLILLAAAGWCEEVNDREANSDNFSYYHLICDFIRKSFTYIHNFTGLLDNSRWLFRRGYGGKQPALRF